MSNIIYEDDKYSVRLINSKLIFARAKGTDAFGTFVWANEVNELPAPALYLIEELHALREFVGEEVYQEFLTATTRVDKRGV